VSYLYLASFLSGILLGVRLLFFGAERRRLRSGALPLRRSEPAVLAFLVMFGLVGYLCLRSNRVTPLFAFAFAAALGIVWAYVVTRLAIATARITPEVNPDDPRFALQGRVAVATVAIESEVEGQIRYDAVDAPLYLPARNIIDGVIPVGDEVCIERVEGGVAYVEHWPLVEKRL
jgi:membrane protein implicated in regulation of membrane protease activity